jgi:hypothetical protein
MLSGRGGLDRRRAWIISSVMAYKVSVTQNIRKDGMHLFRQSNGRVNRTIRWPVCCFLAITARRPSLQSGAIVVTLTVDDRKQRSKELAFRPDTHSTDVSVVNPSGQGGYLPHTFLATDQAILTSFACLVVNHLSQMKRSNGVIS